MPDEQPRQPSLAIAEIEDLTIELDQRNAELELARTDARHWREIALALAGRIRERRTELGITDLDLVEINTTLTAR